jgi:hypothetical protein
VQQGVAWLHGQKHIAEPTLYYLEHLAKRRKEGKGVAWRDIEGNVILQLPAASSSETSSIQSSP